MEAYTKHRLDQEAGRGRKEKKNQKIEEQWRAGLTKTLSEEGSQKNTKNKNKIMQSFCIQSMHNSPFEPTPTICHMEKAQTRGSCGMPNSTETLF